MNKVTLIGRLVKDPELKTNAGTGTVVTNITLAVPRYNSKTKQNEADFIPVQIWGKRAESVAKYTKKGSQISVSGSIHTGSYMAKDGTKKFVTNVLAQEVEFLGTKNDSSNTSSTSNTGYTPNNSDVAPIDDGSMPF